MAVHVSATFKKDEREQNGLERIREALINDPLTRHTIIATIETTQIITDVRDGGVKTPRVRLVNVEAVDGEDAVIATKLLNERYAARTGQTAPPPTLFDPDVDPSGLDPDDARPWPGDAVEDGTATDAAVEVNEAGESKRRKR